MKALLISDFILAGEQGAKQSSIAHYLTLNSIFGEGNVDIVAFNATDTSNRFDCLYKEGHPSKIKKLINILSGSCFLLSKSGEKSVVNLCKINHYDLIFVDHSIYGHLIRGIKSVSNALIVTYFHGIMQYQNEEYKKHNKTSFLYFLPCYNMKLGEILTVKYSDKCLLLNERDNSNFMKYYHKDADGYLPVYFYENNMINPTEPTGNYKILFVGGFFWPNIHGITWFVDNVMPLLSNDIQLDIVGNGMEKLRDSLERENVHIHGRVVNLDDYYNDADLVIGPIFEGEGMKTKTCEALMYGKIYLGTDEALEGYKGLDAYRCNTKEEYVKRITELKKSRGHKYHPEMKELYDTYYSPQMAEGVVRMMIKELEINK